MQKRIVALSGSLKEQSSNAAILKIISAFVPQEIEYKIYNGIDKLPFFNPDLDNENVAEHLTSFRSVLGSAHGVIICTPEYAFGIPGVLKNALEWLVSSATLYEKPVVTISASPSAQGGDKAHESLRLVLTALGARLTDDGQLTIPSLRNKIDQQGVVTDKNLLVDLENLLAIFIQNLAKTEKA
ncbi:NADPH-dependent FMN reductase [Chryseosolibacter indicus]|uniref:NAD(P)H-dependent oxidoreductase n=1 Tax=Chryseosolibacter indicus TaxID=2782351 RepID=A0ABS5VLQ8_9BACT|nr:NAD(P)H-dependent oxidoreductase [Chryseosolibacter indicus]MBT1702390.1 NAD(P)H-dependent oxidoreductase [Chryseosolibacter indicus]